MTTIPADTSSDVTPAILHKTREERDRLVTENLGLAYKYARQVRRGRADKKDLESAAILGLIEGANRYDPSRGLKFSTCAVPWIRRNVIEEAWRAENAVYVPRNMIGENAELRRTLKDYDQLKRLALKARSAYSIDRIVTRNFHSYISKGQTYANSIVDRQSQAAPSDYDSEDILAVRNALDSLDPRTREIVDSFFDLAGQGCETYQQIGDRLGLSRQRIHQIVKEAVESLRVELRLVPPPKGPPSYTHDGLTMTMGQWARHLGISRVTLYDRLRSGWPIARVFGEPVMQAGERRARREASRMTA